MSETSCRECGKAYPPEVLDERFGGVCPRCLAGFALEEPPTQVTDEPPPLKPGATFRGLQVVKVLGQGGMGIVYQARQIDLERPVALKLLAPRLASDPEFAQRFTREARVMASLNHPHIVQIYEYGREGDLYFLAMEFVDGVSLRDLMRERQLTPAEALAIVPQICEALAYAHTQGVVHRDIKPENILLDRQGRVKIADFGLAKMASQETARVTKTNAVMGTPHYMAPEQYESTRDVDHRADIYSLGVVFYEMLTGQVPMGKFDPPSKCVEVDVRLDRVVLKALEREPERRYQYASEVKEDVTRVGSGRSRKRSGRLLALAWVGALLFLAAGGLRWYMDRSEKAERAKRDEIDRHLADGRRALEKGEWESALHHFTLAKLLGSSSVDELKLRSIQERIGFRSIMKSIRREVEQHRKEGKDPQEIAAREHHLRSLQRDERKRALEILGGDPVRPQLEDFVLTSENVPKGLRVHRASYPAILDHWQLIVNVRGSLRWLEEEDLNRVVRVYHCSFEPGDFGFVALEFLSSEDIMAFFERASSSRGAEKGYNVNTFAGAGDNLVIQEYHRSDRTDTVGPWLLRRWLGSVRRRTEEPERAPRIEDYLLLESELPASIRFSSKPDRLPANPFLAPDGAGVAAILEEVRVPNLAPREVRRGYVAYLENSTGDRYCFSALEVADNDVLVRLAEQSADKGYSCYGDRFIAHLFRLAEGSRSRAYDHLSHVIYRKHRIAHGEPAAELDDLRFHLEESPPTFALVGEMQYVAHREKTEDCCRDLKDPPVHREHDVSCRWRIRRANEEYVITGYKPCSELENPKLRDALSQVVDGERARLIFTDQLNVTIEGPDLTVVRQLEEWLRRRLGLSPGQADAIFAVAPETPVREWGNWLVCESGNYAVFVEKGARLEKDGWDDRRIARDLKDKMELFRTAYESLVKVPAKLDPKPIVKICASQSMFESNGGVKNAVAIYSPRSKELVGTVEESRYETLLEILSHEALHLFLAYTLPNSEELPPWLSEGLAMGFASHEIRDGKLVPFLLRGEAALRRPVARQAVVSLGELMAMHQSRFLENAPVNYASAWSFCHFLWNTAHREKLLKLFTALQAGQSWKDAFRNEDFIRLEEEWKEFLRKL